MSAGVATRDALIIWGRGDAKSEYLAAGLLKIEDAKEVDPIHPQGGPDGKKDLRCKIEGVSCVVGVGFHNASNTVTFSGIRKKFKADLKGRKTNNAQGFVFVTNVHLTEGERQTLEQIALADGSLLCRIYHLERIRALLDQPTGYGLREQYLGIPLTAAERLSYDEAVRLGQERWTKKEMAEMKAQMKAQYEDLKAMIENLIK